MGHQKEAQRCLSKASSVPVCTRSVSASMGVRLGQGGCSPMRLGFWWEAPTSGFAASNERDEGWKDHERVIRARVSCLRPGLGDEDTDKPTKYWGP
mmetsp:Transcript_79467/g.132704  ORF Transcript_79467/g.132704 Transcript_79467/m.132704 type:complete len:96 (-) Transcript_79467:199-486(-)